jgi:hypothetical protein
VQSLVFCPNGRHFLSSSADQTVRLWDIASGALLRTYRGHTDYIRSVVVSPDGRAAVSGSDDCTIRYWRLPATAEDVILALNKKSSADLTAAIRDLDTMGPELAQWLGEAYTGVIHCDRVRMYWSFGRLQWCWAHLKRDMQGPIDSPCSTARRLGRDLMRPTKKLFVLCQKARDGTLSRPAFVEQLQPIRAEVESLLLRGYFNARVSGFCKGLWEHRQNLWTFLEVEGVTLIEMTGLVVLCFLAGF